MEIQQIQKRKTEALQSTSQIFYFGIYSFGVKHVCVWKKKIGNIDPNAFYTIKQHTWSLEQNMKTDLLETDNNWNWCLQLSKQLFIN